MLGNSGKPVTLETLSLTKFLRHVFQEQETHDFRKPGTCETSDSRSVKFGNRDSVKKWGREHAEARNLELAIERTLEDGRFGNLSRAWFGSHRWRHSRTDGEAKSKLLSQKSGFRVWTSGRFVNMLDEKDILVCVHTRNIPWAWGCFWYIKVPPSPYKRGREGTCKRIQIFGNLCNLQRKSQSLCALTYA
jgi:hypothetical protein